LDRNSISDISALKDLSSLEELLLYKNNIENIDALKDKKYLYRLMLNENIGLRNIDALKDVPNISSVDISDTAVTDISALK
ncbi:hypothetical protein AB9F41_37035, partial [Rhizobium leguminosarum]|uniref:hypothetical protein n=1 Tax=Rhizobium leguminosarum TaxID=384 RepID=UPI003F9B55D7